jgi:Tol biopolymer transport system component
MPLAVGTRLGSYEIVAPIGAGGMGEVYRARDTKLNRDVALKILPDTVAADPDRLARFRREAQVLASLNHPNIGQIYGFEDGTSPFALVLELIEGPTLADRIADGPIPVSEAMPIARQIAEALEAAHEHGIIHRDLKPANVKVKDDGVVKVLDFGLAKALDPTAASSAEALNSPTLTMRATQMGLVLGTAAYMSPEQAKGKTVDRRADIWAFGAVLYEMLSGKRAFPGDDISDTLAAVLRHDVDWTALPADTPAAIRRLMARCLDRDVKRRLRDIGEARILLEAPFADAAPPAQRVDSPPVAVQSRTRRALSFVVATIAVAGAAGAGWYLRPLPPSPVVRFTVPLGEGQAFTTTVRRVIDVSPDGRHIVFTGSPARLFLRTMSDLRTTAIAGTEGHEQTTDPTFSPDGRFVAFYAAVDRTLKRIAVNGGAAVTLCPADSVFGVSWTDDGIVFGQGTGIMRVPPAGGNPERIAAPNPGETLHGPQLLAGGQHVLFTRATGSAPDRWDRAHIVVQSIASGERKTLIEGGSDGRYLPSGHIVYAFSGILFAVPFDLKRLEVGTAVPVVQGVRRASTPATGVAQFGVSRTGTLAYVAGPAMTTSAFALALSDRKGVVQPLKIEPGPYAAPRVSPDGKRVAFIAEDAQPSVMVYDLDGATAPRRLTLGGKNRDPVWTADSKRLAFQSDRERDFAIFWQPADGTGPAERLTKPAAGESHVPQSWSPNGETLLFDVVKASSVTLWSLTLRDQKIAPFGGVHSSNQTGAVFSPDGRWIAYTSTDAGKTTIYVQPFPATGAVYPMVARSIDVPHEVMWSADGKELFYNPRAGGFEVVSVTTQPTFAFGNPTPLPRPFQLGPPAARRAYDVTPDGRLMVITSLNDAQIASTASPQIQVVINWFEELKTHTRN